MTTIDGNEVAIEASVSTVRRRIAIAVVAVLLLAGAVATPLRTLGVPLPGSIIQPALGVAAVLSLGLGAWRWWRLLPRPMLVLGVVQTVLSVLSVAWAPDRSEAAQGALSALVGLVAAILLVGAVRYLRTGWKPLVWWSIACVAPCLLMWAYVPAFAPDVLSTTPYAWATMTGFFARLGHPWIGPSNNIATLFVPLILPLGYLASRSARWVVVPYLVVVAALAATLSRGALLGLCVGAAVWFVLSRRQRSNNLRLAVAATLVAVLTVWFVLFIHPAIDAALIKSYPPAAWAHEYANRRGTGTGTGTTGLSTDDLLAGRSGAAGLDAGRLTLLRQGLSDITPLGKGAGFDLHVHNTYLQQVVNFGVVGGPISIILMLCFSRWWFRQRVDGRRDMVALTIGCGILGQMVLFLVESSYESNLLRAAIWIEWGLLLATYRSLRTTRPPAPVGRLDVSRSP